MRARSMMLAGLGLATVAGASAAQVAAKAALTMEGAERVAMAVVAEARRLNTTGAVAVVDDGGNLMYLARVDNTFPAGAMISYGKARTSAMFKKPSGFFEDLIKNGRTPMIALNDFTPLHGGIPLEVGGQIVGGVGVSGAASAAQDEELAVVGAKSLGMSMEADASVKIFPKADVERSFAAGGVLVNGADGRRYQVHTSRRDNAGAAEVHTVDTDVFYMLSGSATIVTGGKVIGSREIAANEWRGEAIEGGAERRIVKGDVVVIPAGTPHWFKSVDGLVTYYAVKSH